LVIPHCEERKTFQVLKGDEEREKTPELRTMLKTPIDHRWEDGPFFSKE
jgi:hypothetical protein